MKMQKLFTCTLLYLFLLAGYCAAQTPDNPSRKQVKFFFPGAKPSKNAAYNFTGRYTEVNIPAKDSILLNAVLFRADSSKGVIFYLHGNTGSIEQWGGMAKTYTRLHYDLFLLDYRGYGKSQGVIQNEAQLYSDVQLAYDYLKAHYQENRIVVLGYSIGTGPAAYVAAHNHPQKLILQAPYYSLPDAVHYLRPGFDTTSIAFHFNIYQYLKQVTAPVYIFHGDKDERFYYGSSEKLKAFFKPGDELITLPGAGHGYMDRNPD